MNYLTFCSYKHNRQLSPEVTPEQWKPIFGAATEQLETQYQKELFQNLSRLGDTIPAKQPPEERDREERGVGE